MKKNIVVGFLAGLLLLGTIVYYRSTQSPDDTDTPLLPSVWIDRPTSLAQDSPAKKTQNTQHALFVTYWNMPEPSTVLTIPTDHSRSPDTLIYFGITPAESGIDRQESGYRNLEKFRALPFSGKRVLTVRVTQHDSALRLLSDTTLQNAVISDSIAIAQDFKFVELLIDLEVSIALDSGIPDAITSFITSFSESARESGIGLSITLYGDVFYRNRPYDVDALSQVSDHIYIMAYDLNKASGEPGPNFPLYPSDQHPYSLAQLNDSLLSHTNSSTLGYIFGLYGYDWTLDGQKRPLRSADVITTAQAMKKFINQCTKDNCSYIRDQESTHIKVSYTQGEYLHEVWFEDVESIKKKVSFLETKDISAFAYWTWGYY